LDNLVVTIHSQIAEVFDIHSDDQVEIIVISNGEMKIKKHICWVFKSKI